MKTIFVSLSLMMLLVSCGTSAGTSSLASSQKAAAPRTSGDHVANVQGNLARDIMLAFNQAGLVDPGDETADLSIAGLDCNASAFLSLHVTCTLKNLLDGSGKAATAIDQDSSVTIFKALQAAGVATFVQPSGSSHDGGLKIKTLVCNFANELTANGADPEYHCSIIQTNQP